MSLSPREISPLQETVLGLVQKTSHEAVTEALLEVIRNDIRDVIFPDHLAANPDPVLDSLYEEFLAKEELYLERLQELLSRAQEIEVLL